MVLSFRIKKMGAKLHITVEEQLAIVAMNLLEAEPSSGGAVGVVPDFAAPGPDIPALREKLAVLVSTGKVKEAIGVQLTYNQVKRLSDKDVKKYYKRNGAFVGVKATDNLIGSFLMPATKAMCTVLPKMSKLCRLS